MRNINYYEFRFFFYYLGQQGRPWTIGALSGTLFGALASLVFVISTLIISHSLHKFMITLLYQFQHRLTGDNKCPLSHRSELSKGLSNAGPLVSAVL